MKTKHLSRVLRTASTLALSLVTAVVCSAPAVAWGPERDTFTMDSPPTNAVFNSYTDNPLVGDERQFVRIVENGVGDTYSSDITLEAGKQYQVYIYYMNDASPSASTEKYDYSGVAKDVRVSSNFPDKLAKNERAAISGSLSASNTEPEKVWDEAYVTAKEDMTLHYVKGSAKIWNSGKVKGSALSTSLFSKEGTFLGFDELDGVIPSTDEGGSGSVVYTIQTKKAESAWHISTETIILAALLVVCVIVILLLIRSLRKRKG